MDNSSEWGQVGTVDLILGNEPKITNVPIHVINYQYSNPPAACSTSQSVPDTDPSTVGFNGIIGVGLFAQDCGETCTVSTNPGLYYSCNGSTCTGTTASLANQLPNPVGLVGPDSSNGGKSDNNGIMLQFPGVSAGGASSLTGYLVMGIGTRTNNTSNNVSTYTTDENGNFTTVFNPFSSTALSSFIDSGSNLLYFPFPPPDNTSASSILPDCGNDFPGFFCPSSTQSFAAANTSNSGSVTSCVGFSVANPEGIADAGNIVSASFAGSDGSDTDSYFDWGLPFFFGRQVFVGIENTSSTLGTGPYWAY